MTILVVAEHDNASLKGATLNTVTAASRLGSDISVLVVGAGCAAVAEAAAKVAGVTKVLVADAAAFADQSAENVAAQIVAVVKASGGAISHVLAPATTSGKNVLPRVAAVLDVAQISEIVGIESADTFVRPIYAGNALATVKSSDAVKVITVRTTAFEAAGERRHGLLHRRQESRRLIADFVHAALHLGEHVVELAVVRGLLESLLDERVLDDLVLDAALPELVPELRHLIDVEALVVDEDRGGHLVETRLQRADRCVLGDAIRAHASSFELRNWRDRKSVV